MPDPSTANVVFRTPRAGGLSQPRQEEPIMSDYQIISAEEAKALMASESVTILDMRDHRSYRAGHIDGARMLHEDLEHTLLAEGEFERPLLFYCYRGIDSRAKAEHFANVGFQRVYSLENGFTGWPRDQPGVALNA
jgi:thiosulfate sulfurtransferase